MPANPSPDRLRSMIASALEVGPPVPAYDKFDALWDAYNALLQSIPTQYTELGEVMERLEACDPLLADLQKAIQAFDPED